MIDSGTESGDRCGLAITGMPFPRGMSFADVAGHTCGPVTFPGHRRRSSLDRSPQEVRRNTPRNTRMTRSRNIRRTTPPGRSPNLSRLVPKPTSRLFWLSHCLERSLRTLTGCRMRARQPPERPLPMSRTSRAAQRWAPQSGSRPATTVATNLRIPAANYAGTAPTRPCPVSGPCSACLMPRRPNSRPRRPNSRPRRLSGPGRQPRRALAWPRPASGSSRPSSGRPGLPRPHHPRKNGPPRLGSGTSQPDPAWRRPPAPQTGTARATRGPPMGALATGAPAMATPAVAAQAGMPRKKAPGVP